MPIEDYKSKLSAEEFEVFTKFARNIGRPTVYHDEMPLQILFCAVQGFTVCQTASYMGICRTSYYAFCKQNEEFMNSHKEAKTISRAVIEAKCLEQVKNPTPGLSNAHFLYCESRLRREHRSNDQAVKVNWSECTTNEERVAKIYESVSKGDLAAAEAQTLMTTLKNADELLSLPGLLSDLDALKTKLKLGE